jgi:HAD superfamily hydrolase (TIGR01509 family)
MSLQKLLTGKKLLMWDFDGTLVNSEPIHHEAYAQVIAKYGYQINPKTFGESFSRQGLKALDYLNIDPLKIYWEKQDVYRNLLQEQLPKLFEEIPQLLSLFQSKFDLEMIIVTNSYRSFVERVLKKENLEDCFSGIYTRENDAKPKPSPEIYLYGLKQHKRQPREALVFEDGLSGLKSAIGARLDIVWFKTVFGEEELPPLPPEVSLEAFSHQSLLAELEAL